MNTEASKEERYRNNLLNAHLDSIDLTIEAERELNRLRDEGLDAKVNKCIRDITHDETIDAIIINRDKYYDLASMALKLVDRDFDIVSNDECRTIAFAAALLFKEMKSHVSESTDGGELL